MTEIGIVFAKFNDKTVLYLSISQFCMVSFKYATAKRTNYPVIFSTWRSILLCITKSKPKKKQKRKFGREK